LTELKADVMVVAAYGMLLPKEVLSIPRYGCLNIHPSLLPRWRGAAPIQRTILAGDPITGVTIMQMDAGLDTGPILLQRPYQIGEFETSQSLHDKMATLGADCLIETVNLLAKNSLTPQSQQDELATYATKITKEEAQIDWTQTAQSLECKIRSLNPKPVAYTLWNEQRLKIWMAKTISTEISPETPGTILQASPEGIDVATANGVLRLLALQLPGGKKLSVADFYHAKQSQLKLTKKFSQSL